MSTLIEAVDDFLSQKRIAVAGVSRDGAAVGNSIYKKLRDGGYKVYAINPNATEIEGDRCYPSLSALPEAVDGVVIATHPQVTAEVARECAAQGISRVWIHSSFGQGSYSDEAVEFCRAHDITVIPAGCPMMFCEPVDVAHKCFRWFFGMTGKIPKEV
jgi:hypothetical protein